MTLPYRFKTKKQKVHCKIVVFQLISLFTNAFHSAAKQHSAVNVVNLLNPLLPGR